MENCEILKLINYELRERRQNKLIRMLKSMSEEELEDYKRVMEGKVLIDKSKYLDGVQDGS